MTHMPMLYQCVLLFVLSACFCSPVSSQDIVVVGGATLPQMMWNKLHFAFSILQDDSTQVDLIGVGSGAGKDAILNDRNKYNLISTEIPFTDQEFEEHDYLFSFPVFGSAIVPVINLPGISESVTMTPYVLAKILNGDITQWNDPEILENSPLLVDINETITITASSYVSGITHIYTTALERIVPWWAETVGAFDIWSEEQKSKVSYHDGVGGATGLAIFVEYTPYTLSFVPVSAMQSHTLNYIDLLIENELVSAYDELSHDADVTLDEHLRADIIGVYKWPMMTLSYMAVDEESLGCEAMAQYFYYFTWALNSSNFITAAGYIPLNALDLNLQTTVQERFFALECDGNPVIYYDFLHNETYLQVILLVIMLVLAFSLLLVFIYISTKIHLKIEQLINVSFAVGSEILILSVIFWYLEPSSEIICQFRLWMTTVGFMILNGVSVSKSWQLIKISRMNATSTLNNNKIFFVSMITSTTIQLVFLLIWTISDPFTPTIIPIDELFLQYEYTCSSTDLTLWLVVQFSIIGILTLWGFFTTYRTWKLTNLYDPRFNLFTLYFTGVMVAAIGFLVSTIEDEEQTYFVMVVSIFLLATGTLLPHFVQTVRTITKSGSREKKKSTTKSAIEYAKKERLTK